MDDLISRQDAVECVYKALKTPPLKGVFTDTMSLAIGMVNDLPPAQPEITEQQVLDYCHDRCLTIITTGFLEYLFNKTLTIEERKKGRWILSDEQRREDVDNGNYRFICSECGKSDTHSKAVTVSFCWNCGADMREEKTDEV